MFLPHFASILHSIKAYMKTAVPYWTYKYQSQYKVLYQGRFWERTKENALFVDYKKILHYATIT